jgi:putative methyltransferase (TIGR04325 family)
MARYGSFGVFRSFADARTFCNEHGVSTRYDLDHDQWESGHREMHLHDYPMLYWLSRGLTRLSRVGDLGGSVGVSYYALRRLLPAGSPLEWRVFELADVCEKGRMLARQRGATALHFTTDLEDLDGHDVWFSAGAIQFIERPIHELLGSLHRPPRHLLLNRVPMHDAYEFVTLQNTGSAITPCHVFHMQTFRERLRSMGYEQRDAWRVSQSLYVPMHSNHRVQAFRGFYFENSGC